MLANSTCKFIFFGTKLAPKFNINDEISKIHKHDLICKAQCPDLNCDTTYVGEIGRRFSERIIDHLVVMLSHTFMNTQKRPDIKM